MAEREIDPARWDGEPTYVGYYPCQHGAQK